MKKNALKQKLKRCAGFPENKIQALANLPILMQDYSY